jgi:hypothetical protein
MKLSDLYENSPEKYDFTQALQRLKNGKIQLEWWMKIPNETGFSIPCNINPPNHIILTEKEILVPKHIEKDRMYSILDQILPRRGLLPLPSKEKYQAFRISRETETENYRNLFLQLDSLLNNHFGRGFIAKYAQSISVPQEIQDFVNF